MENICHARQLGNISWYGATFSLQCSNIVDWGTGRASGH